LLRKLSLQTFWILLLVLSSFWVAATFLPFFYSLISPTQDLAAIIRALQRRGTPPSEAVNLVREILERGGSLGRAIHIGHYVAAYAEYRNGTSHTTTRVEDSYVAWFSKIPKPFLLVVRRYQRDGAVERYEIDSSYSVSPIARAYALPLMAWLVTIYLVRKRKSPLLSDPQS